MWSARTEVAGSAALACHSLEDTLPGGWHVLQRSGTVPLRCSAPASPPGGVAPVWVNAVIEPRAPGQLPVPELADLAALALRRCYEQLEAGGAVSVTDAVAAMRLAWQIERDEAIPARDKALADLAEAQAVMLGLKDAIIGRCGQDEWRALWGEVLKELERAREIRRVRERFVTAARRVH